MREIMGRTRTVGQLKEGEKFTALTGESGAPVFVKKQRNARWHPNAICLDYKSFHILPEDMLVLLVA